MVKGQRVEDARGRFLSSNAQDFIEEKLIEMLAVSRFNS